LEILDYIYVINISNYPGFGVSVASRKQFTKLGFILGFLLLAAGFSPLAEPVASCQKQVASE